MLLQSLNYCSCAFNYACHSLFTRTHKCIIQCAESLPFIDTNYSLGGALAFYVTIHEWVAAGAEGSSGRLVAPEPPEKNDVNELTSLLCIIWSLTGKEAVSAAWQEDVSLGGLSQ